MAEKKSESRVIIPTSEAESIKSNLQRVQEELGRVRDKAREEADTLERIRGMIDLKYLNDLLSAIEELEERVNAMDEGTETQKVRDQLETEQERLAKLWDAFKTQEDELRATENERDALLKRLEELEDEMKEIGSVSAVKAKLDYLETENKRLSDELRRASELTDDYRDNFEKEQERLAKLFKVYEDMSAQLEKYQEQEAAWREWREKHWEDLPDDARKAGDKLQKKFNE